LADLKFGRYVGCGVSTWALRLFLIPWGFRASARVGWGIPGIGTSGVVRLVLSWGVRMNSKKSLVLVVFAAMVALSSCSGLGNVCTTNCGGGGSAGLSLTISDTPPTNTSVVSFSLPIIGITLTPSSGSAVPVFAPTSAASYELTRLQSDTSMIAANVKVAAGTYTAVNVTVSAPSAVYINSSGSAIGTCVNNEVCSLTGAAATITYTFPSGSPLVLTGNTNQWLDLDFAYNNAIVSTSGIGLDVTQAGMLTATTTVPAGLPSGDFANIDDFTGAVTAISSSSVTVQSTLRGSLTAAINSSTVVLDPQNQCTGGPAMACIAKGSIVSLQGVLTTTGTMTASSLDIIDISTSPADEVEGILYPSNCNNGSNYGLILSDSAIFTSSSPLLSASYGTGVCLTLSQTTTFGIDTGILTGQSGAPISNAGFSGTGDILGAQTVRVKITNAATGTDTMVNANATALILRFSRFTTSVNVVSGNAFSITGLPAYFPTFTVNPQVQTYINATLLEGVTSVNSLQSGQSVSISTLLLNPATMGTQFPFQAAKVRLQ
jgi:Domain of unknown function (DUF4382)